MYALLKADCTTDAEPGIDRLATNAIHAWFRALRRAITTHTNPSLIVPPALHGGIASTRTLLFNYPPSQTTADLEDGQPRVLRAGRWSTSSAVHFFLAAALPLLRAERKAALLTPVIAEAMALFAEGAAVGTR